MLVADSTAVFAMVLPLLSVFQIVYRLVPASFQAT